MILARQYRLHSVLLVLLALAALFLWRNTSTLIPRHDTRYEETLASETIGREAGSGLVHLLRRSIPPAQLMIQCVDIWKQDLGAEARTNPNRIASVREIAGLDQTEYSARDLVERYRAVSRLLKERNRKP